MPNKKKRNNKSKKEPLPKMEYDPLKSELDRYMNALSSIIQGNEELMNEVEDEKMAWEDQCMGLGIDDDNIENLAVMNKKMDDAFKLLDLLEPKVDALNKKAKKIAAENAEPKADQKIAAYETPEHAQPEDLPETEGAKLDVITEN
jgi:Mg2+ and Co2+ transporter CorA